MSVRYVALAVVASGIAACSSDPSGSTSGGGAASEGGGGTMAGPGGSPATGGGEAGGGGSGEGGAACTNSIPVDAEGLPDKLSMTGLYADIGSETVASTVSTFAPRFVLWSDGADKTRWVYLPECDGVIDTSDMNDWSLPVGTRMWKEFRVGDQRIETRLIERVGPGAFDFLYGSYVWDPDGTDATLALDGVADALGTSHDVPSENACRRCHGSHEKGGGRRARALGLSAYQLSGSDGEVTLQSLADEGRLSHAPASGGYPAVGADAAEQAALGALHANCGNCHNAGPDGVPQVNMNLWIDVEMTTPALTGAYVTAVSVPNQIFAAPGLTARIEPGDSGASSVWFRMGQRGNNGQMPPVGSEVVDATGLGVVQTWIEGLP